jgi:hypothetical protein
MSEPFKFLGIWVVLFVLGSLALPTIVEFGGPLGGGMLALLLFVGLAATGIATVAYAFVYAWKNRDARFSAAIHVIIPLLIVPSCSFLVTPLAEFAWQAMNGPRNVPIWPY